MKPSIALQKNRAAIRLVIQRHHACNARVFGSVVHGDDQEGSDLDILIDRTSNTSLMDVAKIQVELEKLLGVAVDVLKPVSVEQMELARLRAQLARVTMERDILKKPRRTSRGKLRACTWTSFQ